MPSRLWVGATARGGFSTGLFEVGGLSNDRMRVAVAADAVADGDNLAALALLENQCSNWSNEVAGRRPAAPDRRCACRYCPGTRRTCAVPMRVDLAEMAAFSEMCSASSKSANLTDDEPASWQVRLLHQIPVLSICVVRHQRGDDARCHSVSAVSARLRNNRHLRPITMAAASALAMYPAVWLACCRIRGQVTRMSARPATFEVMSLVFAATSDTALSGPSSKPCDLAAIGHFAAASSVDWIFGVDGPMAERMATFRLRDADDVREVDGVLMMRALSSSVGAMLTTASVIITGCG